MQDHHYLPLDLLRDGESCVVMEVTGDPDWIGRLAEMGISNGRRVHVLRQGSPCLLEVEGTRLSVRNEGALQILVQVVPKT